MSQYFAQKISSLFPCFLVAFALDLFYRSSLNAFSKIKKKSCIDTKLAHVFPDYMENGE